MENNCIASPEFIEIKSLDDSLFIEYSDSFYYCLDLLYPQHHYNKDNAENILLDMMREGYKLVFIFLDNALVGYGGYSLKNSFSWGKYLYVYDLVVDPKFRGNKLSTNFFDYISLIAEQENCNSVRLDTRLERQGTVCSHIKNGAFIFGFHLVVKELVKEDQKDIKF